MQHPELCDPDRLVSQPWLAALWLLFLVHPVWPRSWDYADLDKLRLGCRIGGGLMILAALVTRFGVCTALFAK